MADTTHNASYSESSMKVGSHPSARLSKLLLPLTSKRRRQRYLLSAIAFGFVALWLLLMYVQWSNWRFESEQSEKVLVKEAESALLGKAAEIEAILQQTYHVGRTVSLLPGVRATRPGNRMSDAEDIVASGRMSAADYDTVQQLYNHIASAVAVSEIYIIYDGFNPDLGQVPFVMFDQIIVDKFSELSDEEAGSNHHDIPEEEEEEEYRDYVRQLDYFRQNSYLMGDTLEDIQPINSGLLRTCDNTQYLSISHGDVRNTYGFTMSVPIYDLDDRRFKGLVTTIIRGNVFEAALIGWPVLPITAQENEYLENTRLIDLESPPVNFLLEEQTTGIRISDRRHENIYLARESAAFRFETRLRLPGKSRWVLHNFVSAATHDNANREILNQAYLQMTGISLVLLLLWFAVHMILKAQRRSALQLRQLADIDPLTGLPNRRMIGMYMNAILGSTSPGQALAVIMIDLDDFKQVNDSLGHEAGDRLLIEIAHRFQAVLREEDQVLRISALAQDKEETDFSISRAERVIGRLGGDEFLVILGNLPDRATADVVAGRMLASLREPVEVGLERIYARVSMGIAAYPDDGADTATLLRSADIALYEAKRRGRDQSVTYAPELDADAVRRLKMVAALHEALNDEQFFLVYQPELLLELGSVCGAEALLRWRHPEFGLVMPNEFIPLLERTGLIVEVGEWILQSACRQLCEWRAAGLPLQNVGVNISTKQLAREDFAEMVARSLSETGVEPGSLVLEVTESIFMDNAEIAIESLSRVRELGVRVAIDDFGTGYSSLSYLREIPLDILKIDRSFTVATDSGVGAAICDMLIELARRLELEVVAEGIETETQLEALKGADWIQGYLISHPLESAEFVEKIEALRFPRVTGLEQVAT